MWYCLAIYILILPKRGLEENADLVERKSKHTGGSIPLPSCGILSENDGHPLQPKIQFGGETTPNKK